MNRIDVILRRERPDWQGYPQEYKSAMTASLSSLDWKPVDGGFQPFIRPGNGSGWTPISSSAWETYSIYGFPSGLTFLDPAAGYIEVP